MSKKKTVIKSSPSRSEEMYACEKAILEMFTEKHVTVSEALFIFEKIKFSALYGEMALQVERKKASFPNVSTGTSGMFR